MCSRSDGDYKKHYVVEQCARLATKQLLYPVLQNAVCLIH